jgi:hypothetical protein
MVRAAISVGVRTCGNTHPALKALMWQNTGVYVCRYIHTAVQYIPWRLWGPRTALLRARGDSEIVRSGVGPVYRMGSNYVPKTIFSQF